MLISPPEGGSVAAADFIDAHEPDKLVYSMTIMAQDQSQLDGSNPSFSSARVDASLSISFNHSFHCALSLRWSASLPAWGTGP